MERCVERRRDACPARVRLGRPTLIRPRLRETRDSFGFAHERRGAFEAPEQEQAEVLMTKGIARFLYFSGKPAVMPDKQIHELKLLMASPYELEVTGEDLQPGEKIIIRAGALKGMTGEVVSRRSQKQLILRLESIGYSIIVNVAASLIERF